MSIIQAIIYGIVQGITEFLPVSSTAHLTLLPWIFGWQNPGSVFDVALHFGTAIAVIGFFFKDYVRLISAGFTKPNSNDGRLFWCLVVATIPGGIFGIALNKYSDAMSSNHLLTGILLIIMGIVLYLCDRMGKQQISLERIGLKQSLIVGCSQVLAMIPGVSRSGITMTAGRAAGIDRKSIAKFTFLMSTPIVLGDALYHTKDIVHVNIDVLPFVVAILTSAVVGILSIRFLLNYLKTKSFFVFTVYRFIFGAFIIALFFIRG